MRMALFYFQTKSLQFSDTRSGFFMYFKTLWKLRSKASSGINPSPKLGECVCLICVFTD